MKKLTTIVLGAALVFAAAGQASAAPLETTGEYRARFWYLDNYSQVKADQESVDFWDQRLRVKMTWPVSDTVKLIARADILEFTWDTVSNESATDKEIDFDWGYADMGLGGNTRLQLGKMDVTWGPGVYAKADSRYRARIASKFGDIPVAFAYDKMNEQHFDEGVDLGDWNAYSLGGVVPVGSWKFGVLGIWSDNSPTNSELFGIDVTADGMLGPAKFVFEGAYGTGTTTVANAEVDQTGTMLYAGAFLPLGPVSTGFEFAYSRGDEAGGDKTDALFHDYNGPFNSFILFNQFDLDGWNTTFSADKGVNNAMAAKISGTFAFSKQTSLMAAGVWAAADEQGARASDEMGVEVDALLKYMLTENVTLQTGIGYLFAGDFYGDVDDPMVITAHAIVNF